jgi:hypothetical protein
MFPPGTTMFPSGTNAAPSHCSHSRFRPEPSLLKNTAPEGMECHTSPCAKHIAGCGDDFERICSKIPSPPTTPAYADSELVSAQQPQVPLQ